MSELDAIRRDLRHLRRRMARGEIDEADYRRQRELILADLPAEERAQLASNTPLPIGPSGGAGGAAGTERPGHVALEFSLDTAIFDRWQLKRELGRGGFGVVYEAEDLTVGGTVAIKVLDPSMVAREDLLERFRREVGLMRQLTHERIVRVHDYVEDLTKSLALISMEYVAGCSVRELKTEAKALGKPVQAQVALRVLKQTLEALDVAHRSGVIHRDVAPGNILLAGGPAARLLEAPATDPGVKLVDFGIAGLADRTVLSEKSPVLGTAAYVAPEVLDEDAEITAAADIYGAGAVAYELLTGRLALGRDFPSPSDLRPDLNDKIDDLILGLLAPDAIARPSASVALDSCRRAAKTLSGATSRQGLPSPVPVMPPKPVAPSPRMYPTPRGNGLSLGGGLFYLATAVGVVALAIGLWQDSAKRRERIEAEGAIFALERQGRLSVVGSVGPSMAPAREAGVLALDTPGLDPPVEVHRELPRYTFAALRGVQGQVQIEAIITKQGRVIAPVLIKGLDDTDTETRALGAVANWRFEPARKDGEPVAVVAVFTLDFRVDPRQPQEAGIDQQGVQDLEEPPAAAVEDEEGAQAREPSTGLADIQPAPSGESEQSPDSGVEAQAQHPQTARDEATSTPKVVPPVGAPEVRVQAERASMRARFLNLGCGSQGGRAVLVVGGGGIDAIATQFLANEIGAAGDCFKPSFVSEGLFHDSFGGDADVLARLELGELARWVALVTIETAEESVNPARVDMVKVTVWLTARAYFAADGYRAEVAASEGSGIGFTTQQAMENARDDSLRKMAERLKGLAPVRRAPELTQFANGVPATGGKQWSIR